MTITDAYGETNLCQIETVETVQGHPTQSTATYRTAHMPNACPRQNTYSVGNPDSYCYKSMT